MSAVSPEESLVGRTLAGTYAVERELGAGSYGAVYRARRVSDNVPVALKTLHARFVADATAQARFRREARAASKLDHPHAVRLLDFGIEPDGTSFLVMELVEGRELFKVMYDEYPFSPERTVRVLTQVLDALGSAHAAGFVHRDLKPENVLLVKQGDDGEETVKVTDFGIAKTFAGEVSEESMQLSSDGLVHGTPEYMAPEQGRGDPVDGRSDIYAAGVLLYEILTGALPFDGKTPMDVILAHLTQPVIPPSKRRPEGTVHPGLERVAMRALMKAPSERYQSAVSMREALENAVSAPWSPGSGTSDEGPPSRRRSVSSSAPTQSFAGSTIRSIEPIHPVSESPATAPARSATELSRGARVALIVAAVVLAASLGALAMHRFGARTISPPPVPSVSIGPSR